MRFARKHWSNILFSLLIVLLLVPQTGRPIKVFVQRLIATSPSVKSTDNRVKIESYDWALEDDKGQRVDFNSFKGKKIVINFWATWCPPCIAEMPSFQLLYNDYKDKAVFLFITSDDFSEVSSFMTQRNLDLPIFKELTRRLPELKGNSLPTTMVINENQEILINKVGAADWNSDEVRALLAD
ncbi:MAG: TlpA family protein disulfide reductase [Bacteroidetes bacterium]|nr:TlpA family protein disulfide reductase [Bacteroidota bacterium]